MPNRTLHVKHWIFDSFLSEEEEERKTIEVRTLDQVARLPPESIIVIADSQRDEPMLVLRRSVYTSVAALLTAENEEKILPLSFRHHLKGLTLRQFLEMIYPQRSITEKGGIAALEVKRIRD